MTDDKVASLMNEAAKTLSGDVRGEPEFPSDLHTRCRALVNLLSKITEMTTSLGISVERLPALVFLDSDDETRADDHVGAAMDKLAGASNKIDDAYRLATEALSALSHLKIGDAPDLEL
jgi:hypothetical protein